MKPIIQVHNLNKVYQIYEKPIDRLKESFSPTHKKYAKDFYALKDVSFTVMKGENVGLIGTNGAGKSTLLKIITGVLSETTGTVEVCGKISALLELGTGFNPEYTGIQNIYLNGSMMRFKKEEMDEKIPEILEFADIGDFIYQPVKTYSSGMFARLAFAVAVNVEPEILIVDEALSVGDVRFQLKCMKKMKSMMAGGTTVLFVSHDINAIKRFCTKAIWLDRGQVKGEGDVNEVTNEYLDFLKRGEFDIQKEELKKRKELKKKTQSGRIAEIVSFKFKHKDGYECNEVELFDAVKVEVEYEVYDDSISSPVLGVAIYGMDDDYVCGLNTLLDKVKIPWKKGINRMVLEYPYGLRIMGGKYFFITSLMDETASVIIDSISMAKEFVIETGYVGEGRVIIPHCWKEAEYTGI